MKLITEETKDLIAGLAIPEPKEAVNLNILTLGVPITIHPPSVKGVKQNPFTLREGTEGVIVFGKKLGKVFYHSVHFSPDLPIQLIGFNSLHQYSKVKRHPDDMLKMVLDGHS